MVSFLQDAKAPAQGALDLALCAVKGDSYQPQSDTWKQPGGTGCFFILGAPSAPVVLVLEWGLRWFARMDEWRSKRWEFRSCYRKTYEDDRDMAVKSLD